MFTMIQDGSPMYSSVSLKPDDLWEESVITSNLVWLLKKDIDYVSVDWWWYTEKSSDLIHKYVYDESWLKTIQYDVVLKYKPLTTSP